MKRAWLGAALWTLACGNDQGGAKPVDPQHVAGGSFVARAGGEVVGRELLRDAARARGTDPAVVLSEILDDAVLADAARRRGLEKKVSVLRAERAALSRAVVLRLRDLGQKAGDPTDDEVKAASLERWKEVDVPPSVRVVHAIVLRPKDANAEKLDAMKHLAEALLARVRGASSPEDFEARAKSEPAPKGFDLRAERLPLFAEGGVVVERGMESRMDETFAKAAFALSGPGAQTALVESPFGFHVIRMIEKVPGRAMPFEERRKLFAGDIYLRRTRGAYEAILRRHGEGVRIEIAENADDAMKRVPLEP